MVNDEHLEIVVMEYIEEIIRAKFGKYMTPNALAECISNLVVGTFAQEMQALVEPRVRAIVQIQLLQEEDKRYNLEVDAETIERLRASLL